MKNDTVWQVAAVGALGLAGVIVWRRVRRKNLAEGSDAKVINSKTTQQLQQELDKLQVNTAKTTITEADASLMADRLYAAMKDFGTDWQGVKGVVDALKSADDFRLVVKKFGVRPYGTFGAPLYAWFPSENLALTGWLVQELGKTEMAYVKERLTKIGVTF